MFLKARNELVIYRGTDKKWWNWTSISFFFHPSISFYCSSPPGKTIYFPFPCQSAGQQHAISMTDSCQFTSLPLSVGVRKTLSLHSPQGYWPCLPLPWWGSHRTQAGPAALSASSTAKCRRCWLLPELDMEIHPTLSPCHQVLCEMLQKYLGEKLAFKIYLLMNQSASSRGTVYWHKCFAVIGRIYDINRQTWYFENK